MNHNGKPWKTFLAKRLTQGKSINLGPSSPDVIEMTGPVWVNISTFWAFAPIGLFRAHFWTKNENGWLSISAAHPGSALQVIESFYNETRALQQGRISFNSLIKLSDQQVSNTLRNHGLPFHFPGRRSNCFCLRLGQPGPSSFNDTS